MTAFSADSIESTTVVGYQIQTVGEAYSLQVASFQGIGVSTYNIQDLKPSAPEGTALGGGVFDLQTLDETGGMSEQFYYMTVADDYGITKDGWYNDDGETFSTKTFERGEGFMFNNSTGASAGLTFSGAVYTNEVTVVAPEAYSLMGNIRPMNLSIQDLVPVAPGGTAVGGGVFDLQTLDEAGGMAEQFYYMTAADDYGITKDGWYNDDGETLSTKVFSPAEGFMFNNSTGASAGLKYKK